MNRPVGRSWIISQVATLAGALGAGFDYVHLKGSTRPDAPLQSKLLLGISVCFLFLFFVRLVYRGVLTRRDYFGEEMDHRRSLAKGSN